MLCNEARINDTVSHWTYSANWPLWPPRDIRYRAYKTALTLYSSAVVHVSNEVKWSRSISGHRKVYDFCCSIEVWNSRVACKLGIASIGEGGLTCGAAIYNLTTKHLLHCYCCYCYESKNREKKTNLVHGATDLHLPRRCFACSEALLKEGPTWKMLRSNFWAQRACLSGTLQLPIEENGGKQCALTRQHGCSLLLCKGLAWESLGGFYQEHSRTTAH